MLNEHDAPAPELDYAFLAAWAGVQADGTMTAVGMSFLRVIAAEVTPLAVAGRIRLLEGSTGAQLSIRISPPSGRSVEVSDRVTPSPDESMRYGENRRQVLFVLNTQVATSDLGRYDVLISIDEKLVRTLTFEVIAAPPRP